MIRRPSGMFSIFLPVCLAAALLESPASVPAAVVNFGPEQFVQAGGVDIDVPGYSVPSFVDFNNDGLKDLIVGEGGGGVANAKVRIYTNSGTETNPQFTDFSYAQSLGADLTVAGSGCLGAFPRAVYWDDDQRKDLLLGLADGRTEIYLNVGTPEAPAFDGGAFVQVGAAGSKTNIDVGMRATPSLVDWNNDGNQDLVVGAVDSKVHVYINNPVGGMPDFTAETFAHTNGANLVVPGYRSSPSIFDLDGDGNKDLLSGNTDGKLFFYSNVGEDASPMFSGYTSILSEGVAIDLPGTPRSRPFATDWTGDGMADLLVGSADGKIHLFQAVPEPSTFLSAIIGVFTLLATARSRALRKRC